MKQHYTEAEANAILQRAVERQVLHGGMSREQLEAIASEIGVTSDALDRAEEEWMTQSQETGLHQAFQLERREKWRADFWTYVVTCSFLALINRFVTPGFFWAIFPILFWGMGVALDAVKAFHIAGEEYERSFEEWRRKRENKAKKLEKRQAKALKSEDTGPYPYARP